MVAQQLSWFIKHKPLRFTDLVFSTDVHLRALEWLRRSGKGGILHITGRPGSGKTVLAQSIANALKYNIIDFKAEILDGIKMLLRTSNSTLNGKPNLLIVDEDDIPVSFNIVSFLKNTKIPVLVTSSDLYLRDVETLKIEKHSFEGIQEILKPIIHKESLAIEPKFIFKMASLCNFDVRAIISHLQLFSKDATAKSICSLERASAMNPFYLCSQIFSRRVRLEELARMADQRVRAMCHASAIVALKGEKLLYTVLESLSIADILPDQYSLVSLEAINGCRKPFTYIKEEWIEPSQSNLRDSPMHFFSKYTRDFRNTKAVLHLKKIIKEYKIQELSDTDKEIVSYIGYDEHVPLKLRYKYNMGSSNAVKRDVSLREILEM